MRKQATDRIADRAAVLTEYGRQRLLNYAESFRDLADLLEDDTEQETERDSAARTEAAH